MNSVAELIEQLHSPDADKRFDACEELRGMNSLPGEALSALEQATYDPDRDVAAVAKRALRVHTEPVARLQVPLPLGFRTAILIALGWAVGWIINWLVLSIATVAVNLPYLESTATNDVGRIVIGILWLSVLGGGLSWLIGGHICAILLQKSKLLSKGKSVTLITLGWTIGWAIGWAIGAAIVAAIGAASVMPSPPTRGNGMDPEAGMMIFGCIGGIALALSGGVGGYATARVLKTELGHFRHIRTLWLVVGWSITSAFTGAIGVLNGRVLSLDSEWLALNWLPKALQEMAINILTGTVIIALFSLLGASGMMAEVTKEMEASKIQGEPLSHTDNAAV